MFNNQRQEKRDILLNYLETISGFSDREYQERVWVRGEGPEFDDYTESICHFFDDGDPIIANYNDYEIKKEQLILLMSLRKKIRHFTSIVRFNLGPDFYDSTEWTEVTDAAKKVLQSFDYKKI